MYIYEKKSLKMTTLQVVFNAGALYEKEGRYGTMHLMEHLICKSFEDLQSFLTKEGISWNAYTGDEHVVFHWSGLDSHLTPEVKKLLVDRVLGNLDMVSQEAFDNERATVLQEYGDAFDDPQSGVYLNYIRTHFNYFDAIGRREDVANFSIDDMKEVKKEFFSKPARIIEVGPTKTDFSYVEFETEKHEFAKLKYKKNWGAELEVVPGGDKDLVVCLGKKIVKKSDYPFLKVAAMMLSDGLESPLYQEIRVKRGLSYYSRADVTPLISDSIYAFYACTTKERSGELCEVYDSVISNVANYLNRKRFDDIMSALSIAREKKKILRYGNVRDIVRKDCVQLPKNLNKITYEKVVEIAQKYFNNDNMIILSK